MCVTFGLTEEELKQNRCPECGSPSYIEDFIGEPFRGFHYQECLACGYSSDPTPEDFNEDFYSDEAG